MDNELIKKQIIDLQNKMKRLIELTHELQESYEHEVKEAYIAGYLKNSFIHPNSSTYTYQLSEAKKRAIESFEIWKLKREEERKCRKQLTQNE